MGVGLKWPQIKWVPEILYTFSMAGYIVNVYKFSGTHFINPIYAVWKGLVLGIPKIMSSVSTHLSLGLNNLSLNFRYDSVS